MANLIETLAQIEGLARGVVGNVDPKFGGGRVDLGEIAEGVRVVYGLYHYQRRIVAAYYPNEPLTLDWTTQPVVALEIRRGAGEETTHIRTLAYVTDVEAIGDDLAARVLDHLAVLKAKKGI